MVHTVDARRTHRARVRRPLRVGKDVVPANDAVLVYDALAMRAEHQVLVIAVAVGICAARANAGAVSPKKEVRRMGENFDWKETLPLKLSAEHTYQFQTKSVQAFRSSISAAEAPAGLSHCQRPRQKSNQTSRLHSSLGSLFDFLSLLEYKRPLRL